MSWIDRIRAAGAALAGSAEKSAGSGAAAVPAAGYLPTLGAVASSTGQLVSQGTALTVSAVYACVSIRAQDVSRCTPQLFKRNSKGAKVKVTDHPVARFFRNPNPQQTWLEWCEQMETAYLLRGNNYGVIRRNGKGVLQDIIPVNPDAVLVLESWNGEIFYNVNRIGLWQIAMLRDFPSSIAEEDIFQLRGVSFNSLVGLSTIGQARDSIGVAMGLEQQSARLMFNGSKPSGVLTAKKALTETTAQRLKQQWREVTSGIANAGVTPILEDGIEFKPMQLTSVDMEFMKQRDFQVVDICRFYRVPPFKLGLTELRGINIDQINQDYVNNTIMPDLHRWEQKFAKVFNLDDEDIEVSFDETVLLRADITTRFTANRIALGGAAFVSVNEVRAGEGLPPADEDATGGDAITRPVNMATLGSDVTGTAPDGAGAPAADEGGVSGADNVPSPAKPKGTPKPKPSLSEAAQADSANANDQGRAIDGAETKMVEGEAGNVLERAGLTL